MNVMVKSTYRQHQFGPQYVSEVEHIGGLRRQRGDDRSKVVNTLHIGPKLINCFLHDWLT